jgi:hypothetical protein
MSEWRPKEWDTLANIAIDQLLADNSFTIPSSGNAVVRGFFEAGADTMFRVLKEEDRTLAMVSQFTETMGKAIAEAFATPEPPNVPIFKLTLEEATHKAERFLEDLAGQHLHRLKSIKQEGNIWRAQYDIGILKKKIVEVTIDNKTGKVENYELVHS